MIIWINGAFGAGKTSAAYELQRRLPNSYVYDPENAGYFIRKNIPPSLCIDDFQDHTMWRTINLDMLDYIAGRYAGSIIVPMTVVNRAYYEEIIGTLSEKYDVKHFILYARKETLLRRLARRLETNSSWPAQQIDRCIKAFDEDIPECKIHTDDMDIYQVVDQIAALSGITLPPDGRSHLRRFFDRAVTQYKHIR